MKNVLTQVGISLLMAAVASAGGASVSFAQEKDGQTTTAQQSNIDPESLPGNYGLVRSFDGQELDIRSLDGTQQSYSVPEGTEADLKQGDLVGFDVDEDGLISKIQPPAVDEVIRGTVTEVDMENQTVTLMPEDADQTVDTQVSQGTISKLGLAPGKEVLVTKFQGTWASKLCLPQAAAPPIAAPPVEEPLAPLGGIEEPEAVPAPVAEPIPALW